MFNFLCSLSVLSGSYWLILLFILTNTPLWEKYKSLLSVETLQVQLKIKSLSAKLIFYGTSVDGE